MLADARRQFATVIFSHVPPLRIDASRSGMRSPARLAPAVRIAAWSGLPCRWMTGATRAMRCGRLSVGTGGHPPTPRQGYLGHGSSPLRTGPPSQRIRTGLRISGRFVCLQPVPEVLLDDPQVLVLRDDPVLLWFRELAPSTRPRVAACLAAIDSALRCVAPRAGR